MACAAGLLVNLRTCFWHQDEWDKPEGGMARVRVFNPRLNPRSYTLTRGGVDDASLGGDAYESARFSGKPPSFRSLTVSWEVANGRRGYERARLARVR